VCTAYDVTGTKVPGKPGRPVVNRVSDRDVTVDWAPPDSDGGVTQYIIKYHDCSELDLGSVVGPKIAGRSKSCTFSKRLTFSRTYKFAIAAENKFGIGPLSDFSEFIKTPTRYGRNFTSLSVVSDSFLWSVIYFSDILTVPVEI